MAKDEKLLFQPDEKLQALAEKLDSLQDVEAKKVALDHYLLDFVDTEGLEFAISVTSSSEESNPGSNPFLNFVYRLAHRHGLKEVMEDWALELSIFGREKPLDRLPCANFDSEKECQRSHWRHHKDDCRTSEEFQPSWIEEGRRPNFATEHPAGAKAGEEHYSSSDLRLSVTASNLVVNVVIEADPTDGEISLPGIPSTWPTTKGAHLHLRLYPWHMLASPASVLCEVIFTYRSRFLQASGGLRNVVRTINNLPSDFAGEVTILLNDREPIIAIRNILIILILTIVTDKDRSVDVALHIWGSEFVPRAAPPIISEVIAQFLLRVNPDRSFLCDLGIDTSLSGRFSEAAVALLREINEFQMTVDHVLEEAERYKSTPSIRDRHDRICCRLQRSHCLSFSRFFITGNILPYGSHHSFSKPNKFLYSLKGKQLQGDTALPLDEWDIEDVVAAGKAHGAQTEDLFGCLYFYLSDQLRTFSRRLCGLNVSFKVFTEDPSELARDLREGIYAPHGLPKGVTFDRIDVCNLVDAEHGGIANILTDWAPFLNKNNPTSTLMGCFSSWASKQPNSKPGPREMQLLTLELMKKGRLDSKKMHADLIPVWFKYYVALYDNSMAFEEYLKDQGADEAARSAGVERRMKHTIVPHRIGGRLGDLPNALPHFATETSWYLNVQVCQTSLSERFVEYGIIT